MPRAKVQPFESAVRSASGKADSSAIKAALATLMAARLRKHVARPVARQGEIAVDALGRMKAVWVGEGKALGGATPKQRRHSGRRRGRMQRYTPTAKVDISRIGTFRHYMLKLMREHTDTWAAEAAHAQCDNPKFAKNRLDFGWAASEGYITFD